MEKINRKDFLKIITLGFLGVVSAKDLFEKKQEPKQFSFKLTASGDYQEEKK